MDRVEFERWCRASRLTRDELILSALIDTEPRGAQILPSEMLLFCSAVRTLGINTVYESGRKFGYSTEVLVRAGFEVISWETLPVPEWDARLKQFSNLILHHGDGRGAIRALAALEENDGVGLAVLFDGPKNRNGLKLFKEIVGGVSLCGIHDVCKLSQGSVPNLGRATAEEYERVMFSDDDWWASEFKHLDRAALKHIGRDSHSGYIALGGVVCLLAGDRFSDCIGSSEC